MIAHIVLQANSRGPLALFCRYEMAAGIIELLLASTVAGDPLYSRPQISYEIHYLQKTVDCSSILTKALCNYHSRIYLPSS